MSTTTHRKTVGNGVPFPTFADGTPYTVTCEAALPDGRTGWVLYVSWVDEQGRYVGRDDKAAGKKGHHWEAHLNIGAKANLSHLTPVGGEQR